MIESHAKKQVQDLYQKAFKRMTKMLKLGHSTVPQAIFMVSKPEARAFNSKKHNLRCPETTSFGSVANKSGRNFDSFSNLPKTIADEKRYEISQDQKMNSEISSIMAQSQPRNSKEFIQNFNKNILFYCTHCFQYVFDIQKKRHYPQCKDAFLPKSSQEQDYYSQTCRKLERILALSQYTQMKTNEIEHLFWSIERGDVQAIERVSYPKDYQFFKLSQIEQAFAHTNDNLHKGIQRTVVSHLLFC